MSRGKLTMKSHLLGFAGCFLVLCLFISGPEQFKLYNTDVKIEGGRLINSQGNLAGAHITMSQSVKRLIENIGIEPVEALKMAISVPAAVIQKPELGKLLNRRVEDLIILNDEFEFEKLVLE